jgi:hypothetical protein
VTLEAEAGFAYRPYRHPSTFPDPPTGNNQEYPLAGTDRREHEWTVGASLGRALGEHLRLSLDWSYDHNESTAAVFDYHRHVVGLHLQGSLGE